MKINNLEQIKILFDKIIHQYQLAGYPRIVQPVLGGSYALHYVHKTLRRTPNNNLDIILLVNDEHWVEEALHYTALLGQPHLEHTPIGPNILIHGFALGHDQHFNLWLVNEPIDVVMYNGISTANLS